MCIRDRTISGVIDTSTGTVSLRAVFPNKEGLLTSGGSGNVLIPVRKENCIVVPQDVYKRQDTCRAGMTCIEDYSDSTMRCMTRFYQALDELAKAPRPVRIAYFGDSFIEEMCIRDRYKVGGASKSEWDTAKMNLDIRETSYKNLLENTSLLSPINGVVTARITITEICIAVENRYW